MEIVHKARACYSCLPCSCGVGGFVSVLDPTARTGAERQLTAPLGVGGRVLCIIDTRTADSASHSHAPQTPRHPPLHRTQVLKARWPVTRGHEIC